MYSYLPLSIVKSSCIRVEILCVNLSKAALVGANTVKESPECKDEDVIDNA